MSPVSGTSAVVLPTPAIAAPAPMPSILAHTTPTRRSSKPPVEDDGPEDHKENLIAVRHPYCLPLARVDHAGGFLRRSEADRNLQGEQDQ